MNIHIPRGLVKVGVTFALVGLAIMVAMNAPDIARYAKMSNM